MPSCLRMHHFNQQKRILWDQPLWDMMRCKIYKRRSDRQLLRTVHTYHAVYIHATFSTHACSTMYCKFGTWSLFIILHQNRFGHCYPILWYTSIVSFIYVCDIHAYVFFLWQHLEWVCRSGAIHSSHSAAEWAGHGDWVQSPHAASSSQQTSLAQVHCMTLYHTVLCCITLYYTVLHCCHPVYI